MSEVYTVPPERKITLNDIARELGVNKATVSKAISGKGNLSAETRARILEYIQSCGYRPNAVAQSLARSRTFNIGLLIPGDAGIFDMAFFRDCTQGVYSAAARNGYDVLLTMDPEDPVGQIRRLMEHRKIDGVIALQNRMDSPVVDFLVDKGFPFVLIGETSKPAVPSVDNNNRGACRELTALLLSRGVKNPVLLGGSENNFATLSRRAGFLEGCRLGGLAGDPPVFLGANRKETLSSAIDRALALGADCLMCMDDCICSMTLSQLSSRGIRVPEEMSVASFYDSMLLEDNVPAVTSLHFDATGLGQIACSRLIRMLEGKPEEACSRPEYRIELRQSTK